MTAARRADLAYAAAVIVGIAFLAGIGALALHQHQVMTRDSDFAGIWTGARAIVDGHDPYDPLTWRTVAASYGTQSPDTDVYGYPRWVALLLLPLALLPVEVAATLWLWAGLALAALALRALLRAALPGAALAHAVAGGTLFVSHPAYQSVANGQWTFVLLATTCATLVLLRSRRPRSAAIAALAWVAKPHLFIGYALGAARRDRTFGIWAAALAIVVVIGSTIGAPGWVAAWSARVAPQRIAQPATLYAALGDLLGRPAGLVVAGLVVAIGVAICTRAPSRSDASLALWGCLSLAAAPYAWSYDLLLLVPPFVLAAGAVARRDPRRATILIEAFAFIFILATPALYYVALMRGRETFTAIVPVAAFAALSAILWRTRDGRRPHEDISLDPGPQPV
jgi:hypothetical protein